MIFTVQARLKFGLLVLCIMFSLQFGKKKTIVCSSIQWRHIVYKNVRYFVTIYLDKENIPVFDRVTHNPPLHCIPLPWVALNYLYLSLVF